MPRPSVKTKKLLKALEKTAFASLIADIFISAITLASPFIGKQSAVDLLFVINYILTVIVIVALALMAYIAALSHRHKLSGITGLFGFRIK